MGRLSDQRRSARRPGKRERTRVKKHHRAQAWLTVPGAGYVHVKAGRKHWRRFFRWHVIAHLSVVRNSESAGRGANGQAISAPTVS
jgi:hypothetical protein